MFLSLHHFRLFNALLYEIVIWLLLMLFVFKHKLTNTSFFFFYSLNNLKDYNRQNYLPIPVAQFSTRKYWCPRHPSGKMRTILLAMFYVLCLGLPLDALPLNGQRALRALRGEKLLKRVRRGWMWNQFFLQEEYTGSDYQYIGKVRPAPQPPAVTSANTYSLKTSHVSPFTHGNGRKSSILFLTTLCASFVDIFTSQQYEPMFHHHSTMWL